MPTVETCSATGRAQRHSRALMALIACGATLLTPGAGEAAPLRHPADPAIERVIVRWRDDGVAAVGIPQLAQRAARLSAMTGVPLGALRAIHDHLDVMRLAAPIRGAQLATTLARLRADPSVLYAEADAPRYALGTPNDARFNAGSDANGSWNGQWYLKDSSSTTPAAIGATTAWDSVPHARYVVAVLDTGIDPSHPDLMPFASGGQLLTGYDFVCNDTAANCGSTVASDLYKIANDGSGWDADPADPGDWLSTADLLPGSIFAGCGEGNDRNYPVKSTWHGTRVAGVIAALTNNGIGIAGVAPDAVILPVRVLGKCQGYISDIVAGMYWAAGLSNTAITGIAPPSVAATILNLSLGGKGPCSKSEQDAVDALSADGHLVVVAAGNDGGPVAAPANCKGVLSVAGIRHAGTKVGYSNVSSADAAISIAAPAGNCVNINPVDANGLPVYPWKLPCVYSIETTTNEGSTSPGNHFYTYALFNPAYVGNERNEGNVGTSFAAPIVSGVAALMVQANPHFTVAQLIERMQVSAKPFPVPSTAPPGGTCHVAALTKDAKGNYTDLQDSECTCTTATCGAGMVNAAAAINEALRPQSSFTSPVGKATFGQNIKLDGSSSSAANGHSIVTYTWSADPSVSFENQGQAKASFLFPSLRAVTITLTVTDDAGRTDQSLLTINGSEGTTKAGGGGGALGTPELLLLALAVAARTLRQRRRGPLSYPMRFAMAARRSGRPY
jgi:serine protease